MVRKCGKCVSASCEFQVGSSILNLSMKFNRFLVETSRHDAGGAPPLPSAAGVAGRSVVGLSADAAGIFGSPSPAPGQVGFTIDGSIVSPRWF